MKNLISPDDQELKHRTSITLTNQKHIIFIRITNIDRQGKKKTKYQRKMFIRLQHETYKVVEWNKLS